MLKIVIPEQEYYDSENNEFIFVKKQQLSLEHSLVSISKWESKWCKAFLSSKKTKEEVLDYVRCMTLTQNVDPLVYKYIPNDILLEIQKYIEAPMTATKFYANSHQSVNRNRVITSEQIYYWMTALNIPSEYQKWHINRLLTLIRIASEENNPKKRKMGRQEIMRQNSDLNAARRKALHSKG